MTSKNENHEETVTVKFCGGLFVQALVTALL